MLADRHTVYAVGIRLVTNKVGKCVVHVTVSAGTHLWHKALYIGAKGFAEPNGDW